MNSELDEIYSQSFVEEISAIEYEYFNGVWLPKYYSNIKNSVEHFEVRDDDVWVCSFPKTGTTWTQEMVWCIANNLNFREARRSIEERFFMLEISGAWTVGLILNQKNFPEARKLSIEYANNLQSPRFIHSHLPYHLLPKSLKAGSTKAKIIYITRNPKDTCISFYHYCTLGEGYCGTFENFCKLFLGSKLIYTPFWEHVIGYFQQRFSKNILFLKYEDMKLDLKSVIKQTAAYLKKSMNDKEIEILAGHLSFASMRRNPAVNYESYFKWLETIEIWRNYKFEGRFMRKGETNQWKTEMSEEIIKKFDDWTNEKWKLLPDLKAEFFRITDSQNHKLIHENIV